MKNHNFSLEYNGDVLLGFQYIYPREKFVELSDNSFELNIATKEIGMHLPWTKRSVEKHVIFVKMKTLICD